VFKLTLEEESIEIKHSKNKNIEMKISLINIKKILLSTESRKIINKLKNLSSKPNCLNNVFNHDYIPFSLIIENNAIDLIAQSYQIYSCFSQAIEEIIKYKKNINEIVYYIENKV